MTMTAKFAGKCHRCGGRIAVGVQIDWDKTTRKAQHHDATLCAAVQAQPKIERPVVTADGTPIVQFLTAAKARGLQWPSVRFLAPTGHGRTLRLSIAGDLARVPGSVQVKIDDTWVGRIEPTGRVYGPLAENTVVLDALQTIASDPAAAAKAYGVVMGCCSFCDSPLTDAGSIEVGYGPTCAKRYGLPHTPKGTPNRTVLEAAQRATPERPREVVEASDLGLSAFPNILSYGDQQYELVRLDRDGENDVRAAHYAAYNRDLVVLND